MQRAEADPSESLAIDRAAVFGGTDLVRARFVGRSSPRHTHRELEIGLIVSGSRLVRCRNREYLAPQGSILVFLPGEVHAGAPLDDAGTTYCGFLFPEQVLRGLAPDTGFSSPVLHDPSLGRELHRLHTAMVSGASGPAVERELLATVTTLWSRHRLRGSARIAVPAAHKAARPVQAYLETHYSRRIRLEQLAELSGLSVFYLTRIFRAATGLSPYAYLEQVRVHRAAELLRDGVRISEVACRTGFADQSHLTRLFKRLTGVPPGRYQRSAALPVRGPACPAPLALRARPAPRPA
jgi:AraC-like DNA-binding protein